MSDKENLKEYMDSIDVVIAAIVKANDFNRITTGEQTANVHIVTAYNAMVNLKAELRSLQVAEVGQ